MPFEEKEYVTCKVCGRTYEDLSWCAESPSDKDCPYCGAHEEGGFAGG